MENSHSQNKLKLFENKKIRYAWNAEEEEWYFSVIDVVEVLADSKDYQTARNYWKVLKNRLNAEGADPEKAIVRGAEYYRAKGYTEGWINQRLQTIEMRKELTDEWKARGIEKETDYACRSYCNFHFQAGTTGGLRSEQKCCCSWRKSRKHGERRI